MSALKTYAPIEWCPGCGNFGILNSVEALLQELVEEGTPLENIILVSGVGNSAKIVDYLHVNSFYSIHGRALPAAEAIKLAIPDAKVICFVGDGDSYAEGLDHLIFAAKRNADITVVVHDNRAYGLATGQSTPTSQKSYKASTMPYGAKENPFNPLEVMLACGASFIARGYPVRKEHYGRLLKEAVLHKGFSIIDTLQVCITFNNLYDEYNKNAYEISGGPSGDMDEALKIIRSWNYEEIGQPIPLGIFYQAERPCFEEGFARFRGEPRDRTAKIDSLLEKLR